MSVQVLDRNKPQPGNQAVVPPYETHCVTCDGSAFALGGGSLFCLSCLRPFIARGEAFQASITVRRVPA